MNRYDTIMLPKYEFVTTLNPIPSKSSITNDHIQISGYPMVIAGLKISHVIAAIIITTIVTTNIFIGLLTILLHPPMGFYCRLNITTILRYANSVTYSHRLCKHRGRGFSLKCSNEHSINELSPCVPRFSTGYAFTNRIPSFLILIAAFTSLL